MLLQLPGVTQGDDAVGKERGWEVRHLSVLLQIGLAVRPKLSAT